MTNFIEEIRRLDKRIENVKGSDLVSVCQRLDDLSPKMAKALIAIWDELEKIEEGGNWQMEAAASRIKKIINQQGEGDNAGNSKK